MNRENNVCETSKNYSFLNCIYTKIIFAVGCKPIWLDFLEMKTDFKFCNDTPKIHQFSERLGLSLTMDERLLFDEFKCLTPCHFIKYKVKHCIPYSIFSDLDFS